jgi:AraC-like DNA-binding protein
MLFSSYRPGPPLSRFIEDIWLYQGYRASRRRERILPSGTVEIVFNLSSDELRIYGRLPHDRCDRYSGAIVSGNYCGYFGTDASVESNLMGVHFRPDGAAPCLGVAVADLADAHVDLQAIWGGAADVLWERLCAASTSRERFGILEHQLTARLNSPVKRHAAVAVALEVMDRPTEISRVREVARYVGLSERRLTELFSTHVGMTPKAFGRVRRFQRALAHLLRRPSVAWTDLAIVCGYYDQSHMIRDFRAFAGLTPEDLLQRKNALVEAGVHIKRNHLPLD